MTRNHPDISWDCLQDKTNNCQLQKAQCPPAARPLSESCRCGKVRICRINGDRTTCARMAHLGVLPGSEMELICPGRGRRCMVKVNGGTLSLDELTAETIFVQPI